MGCVVYNEDMVSPIRMREAEERCVVELLSTANTIGVKASQISAVFSL